MRVRALSLAERKRTEEAIGLVVDALEIARFAGRACLGAQARFNSRRDR